MGVDGNDMEIEDGRSPHDVRPVGMAIRGIPIPERLTGARGG